MTDWLVTSKDHRLQLGTRPITIAYSILTAWIIEASLQDFLWFKHLEPWSSWSLEKNKKRGYESFQQFTLFIGCCLYLNQFPPWSHLKASGIPILREGTRQSGRTFCALQTPVVFPPVMIAWHSNVPMKMLSMLSNDLVFTTLWRNIFIW